MAEKMLLHIVVQVDDVQHMTMLKSHDKNGGDMPIKKYEAIMRL